MKQIQLNSKEARSRGEAGMNQAIATAEKKNKDWANEANKFFRRWLSRKPSGYRFQVENFRLHLQINGGLPKPESDRAFGGIVRRAREDKLIKSLGPKPTKSVTAHGCYSNEWIKL